MWWAKAAGSGSESIAVNESLAGQRGESFMLTEKTYGG
jgi:hypothetical protein